MASNFQAGIVRILTPEGETAGTGFVVEVVQEKGWIVTCAHVVEDYYFSGETVELIFHQTQTPGQANILREFFRSSDTEDVAILQLAHELPSEVEPLRLGEEKGTEDHQCRAFGFPESNPTQGLWGKGTIVGLTRDENGYDVVQGQSNQITQGFSGGPVFDSKRQRVIGIVTSVLYSVIYPDQHLSKGGETFFLTPTSILRKICPHLKVSDICPYQGLESFGEEDAVYFYGRKQEIERVLDQLKREPTLLAIFGPSGSGKSSLIQAGVVPQLKEKKLVYTDSDRWKFIQVRPKENPFQGLTAKGLKDPQKDLSKAIETWLSENEEPSRLVLILDQFEEILVSCPEELRQPFFADLLKLSASELPVTVIIVMRNDFYAILAQQAPQLMEQLGAGLVINISPIIYENNLKDIIKQPAKQLGLSFEQGLIETIIRDIIKENSATETQTSYAPITILPLLEFALSQLWKDHEDGVMTHKTYQEMKGVTGSLSRWAEKTFREFKQPELKDLVRRIFLELVHLGNRQENIPDTRRSRELKELLKLYSRDETQQKQVLKVIKTLADKRLIITEAHLNEDKIENDSAKVELIHEALLRDWERFRQWLKDSRNFLEWLQRVETQAKRWQKNRDTGKLWRGEDLLEAEKYYQEQKAELNPLVIDFIESSIEYRKSQIFGKRINQGIRIGSVFLFALALVLFVFYRGYYTPKTTIESSIESSKNHLLDNEQLEALMDSVKAGKTLKNNLINQFLLPKMLKLKTIANLTNTIHNVQEQNRLKGHAQQLTSVCFSANGEKIASGSWDKTIKLWSKEGKLLKKTLGSYSQDVTVRCASQAQRMVSMAKETQQDNINIWNIEIWDLDTNQLIKSWHSKSMIFSLGISPDGQKVVSGDMNGGIKLWDVNHDEPIYTVQQHEGFVNSLNFSQDGNYVASADEYGTIRLWQVNSDRLIPFGKPWRDSEGEVWTLSFHPTRKLLVSGNDNGTIKLWNFQGKELNQYYQHGGSVIGLNFHPDGQMLVSTVDNGTVKLGWFISENKLAFVILGKHRNGAATVTFSPKDNLIASAGTDDRTIKLWRLPHYLYQQGEDVVKALSPDGQRVVKVVKVGSHLTLSTLDQNDSVILETLSSFRDIEKVAFSPNGEILASVKSNGTITLWDVAESLTQQKGIPLKNATINNTISINTITFSQDGQKLAAALKNRTIKVWGVTTGELLQESNKKTKITTLHFDNNNQMLISGDFQGTIKVWHIESDSVELKNTIEAHKGEVSSFWASPNGKLLASGSSDSTIKLWHIDGRTISEVETKRADRKAGITSLEGYSEGQILASGTKDNSIKLWRVKNNGLREIDSLKQYPQPIKTLEFSQDGQILLSASKDNIVIQWDVNLDRLLTTGCDHLRDYLQNNPQFSESDRKLCK